MRGMAAAKLVISRSSLEQHPSSGRLLRVRSSLRLEAPLRRTTKVAVGLMSQHGIRTGEVPGSSGSLEILGNSANTY